MHEKPHRCPDPFPSPFPRWLWLAIFGACAVIYAILQIKAIEVARESAEIEAQQKAQP